MVGVGLLVVVSACSSAAGDDGADGVPAGMRALLDGVDAAAGSVAGQQAALAAVVDPADGLAGCAPAVGTIRLEPVWSQVRPAPQWRPSSGAPPAGQVSAVPTVLRMVRDGRIVGTDVATLHVGVREDGTARIAPFCVR